MPAASQADLQNIATLLFDAIENADPEALNKLYTETAVLWTNMSQRTTKARQVASLLPMMAKGLPARRYTNRRMQPCDGGFIHRHTIESVRPDGSIASVECCAIVLVEAGKVSRIDEYLDSRQLKAVMAPT